MAKSSEQGKCTEKLLETCLWRKSVSGQGKDSDTFFFLTEVGRYCFFIYLFACLFCFLWVENWTYSDTLFLLNISITWGDMHWVNCWTWVYGIPSSILSITCAEWCSGCLLLINLKKFFCCLFCFLLTEFPLEIHYSTAPGKCFFFFLLKMERWETEREKERNRKRWGTMTLFSHLWRSPFAWCSHVVVRGSSPGAPPW